ncbi:MAG: dTDP-4-dehydrorhamnose reductase [Candidatus Glassbacteria bacterium]
MKVLVTGAEGTLGRELVARLARSHTPVAADIGDFDVRDGERTLEFVREAGPDLIIHAAAYTDVDGAEREPGTALAVNATGSENVAAAARAAGARMVLIGTDYVFDGQKRGPYLESDRPNPLNEYGRSKLAAEELARRVLPEVTIVRTAWLYGAHGESFLTKILAAVRGSETLRVVTDESGSPTWASDLAAGIVGLVESGPAGGLYHLAGGGSCSRYELAVEWFRLLGVGPVTVGKTTRLEFPTAARRPANSALASERLPALGLAPLRPWQDALREFAAAEGKVMLRKWLEGDAGIE